MLNLNGRQNLELGIVLHGTFGLCDFAKNTNSCRADFRSDESEKKPMRAVKVRTVVAHGKHYISVIRQHSPADTLVVA
jgi:hypothetical protein